MPSLQIQLIFWYFFVLMSNNEIYNFCLKKMGVAEFMVVFPYVILNCRQQQEGAFKYKLKKIKYACMVWFFCYFSQAYIMQREK